MWADVNQGHQSESRRERERLGQALDQLGPGAGASAGQPHAQAQTWVQMETAHHAHNVSKAVRHIDKLHSALEQQRSSEGLPIEWILGESQA